MSKAEQLLDRLYSAVSEQQYTLNSMGWVDRQKCDKCGTTHKSDPAYSRAGAQKHQYVLIQRIMKEITEFYDSRPPTDNAFKRLIEIKNAAVKACSVGHSKPCNCLCCQVLKLAEQESA